MAQLDAQRASLRDTLLRISGAIQVLEEELDENGNEAQVSANGEEVQPEEREQSVK